MVRQSERMERENREQQERLAVNEALRKELDQAITDAGIRFGGELEVRRSEYTQDSIKLMRALVKKFDLLEAALVMKGNNCHVVRVVVKRDVNLPDNQYVESNNNSIRGYIKSLAQVDTLLRSEVVSFSSAFCVGLEASNNEISNLRDEISKLKRSMEYSDHPMMGFPMGMMPPWFYRR
jgi:hypothetical protein